MPFLALFKIGQVALMLICFLFKSDMIIGFNPISILEEKEYPLYPIPNEEWDVKQFTLLGRMN